MSRAARPDRLGAACLFLAFLLLYGTVGLVFHRARPMAFAYLDQLFDSDVPSRIIDLTRFAGPHTRTQYHPLFVLLLNPPGVGLKAMLRALSVEQSGRAAAILMCATAGALGVAAFFRLLRGASVPAAVAAAWSVVFGLSASQAFFSVFPESWTFSVLALVVLFSVSGGAVARVTVGVLAFGMAVTNVVAVALACAVPLDWAKARGRAVRVVIRDVALVLAVAAALSLVQTWIYAGTPPFWQPSGFGGQDPLSFVWPGGAVDVLRRSRELVVHFLEWCLAAPHTVVTTDQGRLAMDFPELAPGSFRPAGLLHALLWAGLLVAAAREAALTGSWRRPLPVALGLWILALAALHLVFGTSLFLYSGQWAFAVMALVAVALGPGPASVPRPAFLVALVALAVLQLAANGALFQEIARTFVWS